MPKIFDSTYDLVMVAPEGSSVEETDPEDFSLHSGFIYHGVPFGVGETDGLEGYVDYTTPSTISADTTYTVTTITHGLGYAPDFQVFIEEKDVSSDTFAHLSYGYISTGLYFTARVNTTTLQILMVNGSTEWTEGFTGRDYGFKYQIFNTPITGHS